MKVRSLRSTAWRRASRFWAQTCFLSASFARSAPALHDQLGSDPGRTITVTIAVALAVLAAAARWVTGRPPDYGRPLVSTPAGAVPANLYGSAFRGFDITLITSLPLLLAPDGDGATSTIAIALGTLAILIGRAISRP